ncbi:hypothetical protein K501DRAFT_187400 [Backusella circina FSU 941]|nr:hypothetical protein K501DRAFT_187400 [Backusella circina FSU 941]
MSSMDHIYGDYCKRHEDALCRIQELNARPSAQAFFTKCKESMQGRTMCWDLPSLLIKPVQRILKYPLLLREIVQLTPENHPDYDQLVLAASEIQHVADHINEIKRRKELIEQLIGEKKRVDRNGLNKRFTRRVHRKKQASTTHDAMFDDLYKQFESKQERARQFERAIQDWGYQVKQHVQALSELVQSLESVYGDSDGIGLRSMRAFKKLVSQMEANSMDNLLQGAVYNRIELYLKLFKNPTQIIQKRNRKLMDYDRARHLVAKGEVPDKALQKSAEVYVSLNAQLLEELPVFLNLTNDYFNIIIDEFTVVQATYWRKTKVEWKTLTIELPFGKEHTWKSIQTDYNANIKRLQSRMDEIKSKPRDPHDSGYFQEFSKASSFTSSFTDNDSFNGPLHQK